jgi:hypothetical protein
MTKRRGMSCTLARSKAGARARAHGDGAGGTRCRTGRMRRLRGSDWDAHALPSAVLLTTSTRFVRLETEIGSLRRAGPPGERRRPEFGDGRRVLREAYHRVRAPEGSAAPGSHRGNRSRSVAERE